MVWSENTADIISVPANPVPGADSIVMDGAGLPEELANLGYTAAMIFNRGAYNPNTALDVKYSFIGLDPSMGSIPDAFTIGAVYNPNPAPGTMVVIPLLQITTDTLHGAIVTNTTSAITLDTTWQDLVLHNGWVWDSNGPHPQCRMLSTGVVQMKGWVSSGNAAEGTLVATFPSSDYNPTATDHLYHVATPFHNTNSATIQIDGSGNLTVWGMSTLGFSNIALDEIAFPSNKWLKYSTP